MFKTFGEYLTLREAASKSVAHLLDMAHSDRLMVIISAFRGGMDQPPPRSMMDLERDIRSQRGYEVIPNPMCKHDSKAPPEIEGPNIAAEMPKTGFMGITKSQGGFGETLPDAEGQMIRKDVCEDSLIVSHRRGKNHPSDKEVVAFFLGLCKKFVQEAFIFKSPSSDSIMLVSANGEMQDLGAFTSVGVLAPYFTMLRKGPDYNARRVAAMPKPTKADSLGDVPFLARRVS